MRRALLARLPFLTRFYGLTPADLDDMTPREIREYLLVFDRAVDAGWRMVTTDG